jgi:hypothetical protein
MLGFSMGKLFLSTVAVIFGGAAMLSSEVPAFTVGEREVMMTEDQRERLGMKWFVDGNAGVLVRGDEVRFYGANGREPVCFIGTRENPFQRLNRVSISTDNKDFQYLAGGPLYRDPESDRIFLFYHAEIHRGTYKNFYSVLGLAVQADEQGFEFKDLGLVYTANIPGEQAENIVEVCGSPYVIKDGYFYVYARDASKDGNPRQSNLSVARAEIAEVVKAGLAGKSATWMKYYDGSFSEPAIGGRSSPLEKGNPGTRWMDVSYNSAIDKFVMVVASNTAPGKVDLFLSCSEDGIHWADRKKIAVEEGEAFYPSIIGFLADPRKTGKEFYVYYTFSAKGGWERWSDAAIVRRKITFLDKGESRSADDGE